MNSRQLAIPLHLSIINHGEVLGSFNRDASGPGPDVDRYAGWAYRDNIRAAFNIMKLSIVGKDYHTDEHVVGYYNTGDRMKYWGTLGAFWGSLWGLLLGAGFFAIPGIGPVLVAGPLLGWVLGALEGAVVTGGMTAIGAGLFSLGIPKDSVLKYEMALKSNKFILVAHGTADEAAQARRILHTTQPHSLDTHTTEAETAGTVA